MQANTILFVIFIFPSLIYMRAASKSNKMVLLIIALIFSMLGVLGFFNKPEAVFSLIFPLAIGIFATIRIMVDIPKVSYGFNNISYKWLSVSILLAAIVVGLFGLYKYLVIDHSLRLRQVSLTVFGLGFGNAFLPAIWEEIYFRGIIQSELKPWVKYRWVAIVLTALIFALSHSNKVFAALNELPLHGVGYGASLLIGGIISGYLREKSSVFDAIIFHGTFNLLNF